jgi:hypothetical protein
MPKIAFVDTETQQNKNNYEESKHSASTGNIPPSNIIGEKFTEEDEAKLVKE